MTVMAIFYASADFNSFGVFWDTRYRVYEEKATFNILKFTLFLSTIDSRPSGI